MVITVKQMSDTFATRDARAAVWTALIRLSHQRRMAQHHGETLPTGLVTDAQGFRQVQIDLH
jgi:hypothetical protein